jgi:hypothetical protein
MRRDFAGKLCAYCAEREATTADHVFGRGFCLEKHRANLPQVPACSVCNGEKSKLEHYLMTVLPFGGKHRDSQSTLQELVPRRLEKNAKLHRELQVGYDGDRLPLRINQIEPLFALIAKGLVWHHWGALLSSEDRAAATVIRRDGIGPLAHIFTRMRPHNRALANIGEGTLMYEGIQATDYPGLTLWAFLVDGGLNFAESFRNPGGKHCVIFAFTGSRSLLPRLWSTVFREELPAA